MPRGDTYHCYCLDPKNQKVEVTVSNIDYYRQWQRIPRKADTWQVSDSQHGHVGRKIVASKVLGNYKSILDVGCGIGFDYEYYRDTHVKYLGVDLTHKFLDVAHKKRVPLMQGDLLHLPFKDASFDVVYCKDLLLHLPVGDWQLGLEEMIRVAKHQIITIEPMWIEKTKYELMESHFDVNQDTGKLDGILVFFHTLFGKDEMTEWARQHGLKLEVWRGKDVERSIWTNSDAEWQVTIFKKD